jgi:ubiquinone/menaquinone biosynthesis C-methylase UbiE
MAIEETKDKKFYDASVGDLSTAALRAHCANVTKYIAAFESRLNGFGAGRSLKVLELGAGSCVTSLFLSTRAYVAQIVCLDISLRKMQEVFSSSVQAVGVCSPGKISMIEGHFDARLPFPDEHFDTVIFDGALHHARSMWSILEECKRVLRPGGVLIAQREQYLGTATARLKLARLLQTPEVQAGVSENAYLRAQYEYYLRAVGFNSVTFLPVAETTLQRMFCFLNGLLFSKWVIWAHSSPRMHA